MLSLAEQIFASGFTFFLFIAASRLLEGGELGFYTALFSLNQSFSFFLFGLVLLPVSSSAGENASNQLGISLMLLLGLFIVFSLVAPLAMHAFDSFEGLINVELWGLAVVFFVTQCSYETARWLCIRLRGVQSALMITLLRFALFFVTILGLDTGWLDAHRFALIQIGTNVLSAIGFGFMIGKRMGDFHFMLPNRQALQHMATFGNSVASFLTNFTVVALVDRGLGSVGLAAFQAVRSATNPIGLISQVLDNHFTAELSRTGRRLEYKTRERRIAFTVSVLLMSGATLFAPQITTLLFAGTFDEYWQLVPLLLMASLAHALTRPIFISWRISGNIQALNLYSLALVVVAFPLLFVTGFTGLNYTMIGLFACMPVAAFMIEMFRNPEVSGDVR